MINILSVADIVKKYRVDGKEISVLNGVNLEVIEGEILIILGPSGAGKSTLLHIMGLLDEPSEGNIRFNGQELKKRNNRRKILLRSREIGFVFQFYNLLSDFKVLENVCLPGLVASKKCRINKELKKRAIDMLEWVGLGDRINHIPGQLSGGEQQRVAIARALINSPKLLLADEPTGNLDTKTADRVWSLLEELNKKIKQTIVIVTHNSKLAERGTRRLYLQDGVIAD